MREDRSDHFLPDGPPCHGNRGDWFEKRLARHGDFGVSKLVVSLYLHAFDGWAYVNSFVGSFLGSSGLSVLLVTTHYHWVVDELKN